MLPLSKPCAWEVATSDEAPRQPASSLHTPPRWGNLRYGYISRELEIFGGVDVVVAGGV